MSLRVEDINQKSNAARLTLASIDTRMDKLEEMHVQTMTCITNLDRKFSEQVRLDCLHKLSRLFYRFKGLNYVLFTAPDEVSTK